MSVEASLSHAGFMSDARSHTLSPSCGGSSVIGIKFKDGVIIAADTLVSYGSLARYTNFDRVLKVNECTALACSGDIADFQYLAKHISRQVLTESLLGDGFTTSPQALHSWITRVMYHRRSQLNPLWNSYIVGGVQKDGTLYLGCTNMLGVAFTEDCVATGFGSYLALSLLRKAIETKADSNIANLTYDDALAALKDTMTVLFYRDGRAFNIYKIAVVTKDGVSVSDNQKAEVNWQVAETVVGYE
ncbi:proteasome prosome macropain subunit beta type [Echinococcus multilocularis]|uniref:Proteasome subunit beta n=1 Tax=Echinococcus multilocularis TaxID=6211 RepID=A0A068YKA8_ECHMU|nr:proteasome prosome macropain subunit beta type [Echinococcus multilocularis]